MGWMRFLTFVFNLLGGLLLVAAVGAFFLGAAAGGSVGPGSNDGALFGAFMGGMMGTIAAIGNFLAALGMFFCGAVLWALHGLLEETQLRRHSVTS